MTFTKDIPKSMRRSLRQEVNFGCAICGCPILEIHHIVRSQIKQHNPSEMIALCPTHHHRADMGEYDDAYLRELKKTPHNLTMISDAFNVQSESLIVSIASNKFINTPRILVVDYFDIISVTKEDQFPLLDVNFFDKYGRWIAIINQNQWYVDRKLVWDIEYKPKHLVIRCRPREISLDVKIIYDIVFIKGNLFFNGYKIEATDNDLFLGGKGAITLHGCTMMHSEVGIGIQTGRPLSFR